MGTSSAFFRQVVHFVVWKRWIWGALLGKAGIVADTLEPSVLLLRGPVPQVVTASKDHAAKVWNAETGSLETLSKLQKPRQNIGFGGPLISPPPRAFTTP
eukprot:2433478-Amphidinium_carterae.1